MLRARVSYRRWTPSSNAETLELLERAVQIDPTFAQAKAEQAYAHFQTWVLGGSTDPSVLAKGMELARQSTELEPLSPQARTMLG